MLLYGVVLCLFVVILVLCGHFGSGYSHSIIVHLDLFFIFDHTGEPAGMRKHLVMLHSLPVSLLTACQIRLLIISLSHSCRKQTVYKM